MTDAGNLAGFALTALLIELTPGPNMTYLALLAATEGRKPGFAAVAGVALGLSIVGLAAAFGLAAVIAQSPLLYQGLRWAGVGYLLWLAYESWRGADEGPEHASLGSALGVFFQRGLINNLLNPKAAVFYVSVLPSFLPEGPAVLDVVTLSAIYVAVATLVHAAIVAAAGSAQVFLQDDARAIAIRRGLALGLVGVAVWVLLKT